jgi:VIT1/CCC1 family predicted Fe2+/Mn2+ transporter
MEPSQPGTRASDADREAAVELLRTAAVDGRLEADELEERLASAYAARWCSELTVLTADITPPLEPLTFIRPGARLNLLAIVSLVSSVLWMFWIGSIAAIVTGHVALHQISRSAGTETGRAAALIGLMFGYFGVAALVFLISMNAL